MKPIEIRNRLLGESVVSALKARHFEAYYCNSSKEALDKALELIPEGSSISWGGSFSIQEIGLTTALKNGNYNVYDRADCPPEELQELLRKVFSMDYFLSSANSISEDGVIFNIDGSGNRLAAIAFGPKNVLFIIGINKIVGSREAAFERARKTAAPINTQRFDLKTPCKVTGRCSDCKSPDSICSKIMSIRKSDGRMKVIIVGESLGF